MSQERPKVLVLGASGGVGSLVYSSLEKTELYDVTGTYFQHPKSDLVFCDIHDRENLKRVIGGCQPKYILNFAGLAQEKLCQNEKQRAYETNVSGVENIVRLSSDYSINLMYPSTINVFSGYTHNEICDEKTHPLTKADSIYGQNKIEAEKIVQSSSLVWAIPRTDLVLSPEFGITKLFEKNQFAQIRINAIRFPVFIESYSIYIQSFIENPFEAAGITHLISSEFKNGVSLVNLAEIIIKRFNLADSSEIISGTTELIPRTDKKSPMPIYVDNQANTLATEKRLFVSTPRY
ncbi:MAG: sugar nucleotide-binding protein [Candidatus Shapirobacteria bacterium]|jgi:dTDP-4-dehydrorhamnose reductase